MGSSESASLPSATYSSPTWLEDLSGRVSQVVTSKKREDDDKATADAKAKAASSQFDESVHTLLVVGSPKKKKDLVEYIKAEEGSSSSGFCRASRAVEYVFEDSCFRMQVPTSWERYSFGNKAAGSVSIIYVCDLQLDALPAEDCKCKTMHSERIEQILADFAEMCKSAWVRKCSIVVLCTGIPQMKDFKGEVDDVRFVSKVQFLRALEFSFRVRCPKSWSAMRFEAIDSFEAFDLRTSIRDVHNKIQFEMIDYRIMDDSFASTSRSSMEIPSNSYSRSSIRASGEYAFMKPELLQLLEDLEREVENRMSAPEMIKV